MTTLRICMVTTFYPPYSFGGDGVAVQRLSRALVRCGHDVTVVHDTDAYRALRQGTVAERPALDDDEGVKVIRLRSRTGSLSPLLVQQLGRPVMHAAQLHHLLRPGQFDVVNFHNISLIGGPGLLRYPSDAVTLYMAHEHWLVCPTHALWRFRRELCDSRQCTRCVLTYRRPPQAWRYTGALDRAISGVDCVIALSDFSRDKHREFGLKVPMDVLPCFLPDDDASPMTGTARPHERPYLFFGGRLERIKGLDDVIPLFRTLTDLDLVIAGEGEHEGHLRRLASGMPNVHFVGRLEAPAMSRYYRHAVASLVPSVCYETFGIVLIESFREGTPVIARRLGPFPEIIERAGAGYLFSDVKELEAAVRAVQRDSGRRETLSRAAQDAVREHWSASVVIPQYLELVQHAAQRRATRRSAPMLAAQATM